MKNRQSYGMAGEEVTDEGDVGAVEGEEDAEVVEPQPGVPRLLGEAGEGVEHGGGDQTCLESRSNMNMHKRYSFLESSSM